MVNGPDDVHLERKGRLERAPDGLFEGEEAVLHVMGGLGGAPVTRNPDGGWALRRGSSYPLGPLPCS